MIAPSWTTHQNLDSFIIVISFCTTLIQDWSLFDTDLSIRRTVTIANIMLNFAAPYNCYQKEFGSSL